jgi:hypothetical protein
MKTFILCLFSFALFAEDLKPKPQPPEVINALAVYEKASPSTHFNVDLGPIICGSKHGQSKVVEFDKGLQIFEVRAFCLFNDKVRGFVAGDRLVMFHGLDGHLTSAHNICPEPLESVVVIKGDLLPLFNKLGQHVAEMLV